MDLVFNTDKAYCQFYPYSSQLSPCRPLSLCHNNNIFQTFILEPNITPRYLKTTLLIIEITAYICSDTRLVDCWPLRLVSYRFQFLLWIFCWLIPCPMGQDQMTLLFRILQILWNWPSCMTSFYPGYKWKNRALCNLPPERETFLTPGIFLKRFGHR